MSLTYKMVEKSCFLLNRLARNCIKKRMYHSFEKSNQSNELPKFMYRKFAINKIEYLDFPVYIVRSRNKEKRNRKAILFLAGGGGLARPMWIHFDTAAKLVQKTGATVYFAYYPLAPKHNVGEALEWLEGVYKAMLKRYLPKDIVLIGDSAGANLALSLIHRVKEKPRKVIVISPAVGLENGRNREIRKQMEDKDPLLSVAMNDLIARTWSRNVPSDSPDINVESIDYHEFSQILLLYGTHELFYPHVKRFVEKLKKDGAVLEVVEEKMCHDWALCSFFPEGRNAMKKMTKFIAKE